jgi:hypothetical protein
MTSPPVANVALKICGPVVEVAAFSFPIGPFYSIVRFQRSGGFLDQVCQLRLWDEIAAAYRVETTLSDPE